VEATDDGTDRRAAFESALGGEYFALNGLRANTTSEANARASLFFTTLTGTLLALGFLAGNTEAAVPVAYAAVPTVGLLGVLSFLRLVEVAVLDVRALQEINRIRSHWASMVPDGRTFFPAPVPGQAVDVMLDTGERSGLFRATLTIAATVGLMDALWIGAGVGAAIAHAGAPIGFGVVAGVIVGVVLVVFMFRHQTKRFVHVLNATRP
jgi:hypothetical protein